MRISTVDMLGMLSELENVRDTACGFGRLESCVITGEVADYDTGDDLIVTIQYDRAKRDEFVITGIDAKGEA